MDRTRLADCFADYMRRQQVRHEEEVHPQPRFSIALSREAGANGAQVARLVGKRLGWAVYDRELVEGIAADMGFRTGLVDCVDERRKHWFLETLESFSSARTVNSSAYLHHLVETLLSLAAQGECVLVGRGAPSILPGATTLRVRLIGNLADRTRAIQERLGLSFEEASKWVARTDADREGFVMDSFHKDSADPRSYDLVLNSSRFSVSECADIIIEALHRLQSHKVATPGASKTPVGASK
jgi:cytidylate kinase